MQRLLTHGRLRCFPTGVLGIVLTLILISSPARSQTEFSGLPAPGVPVFDLDVAAFRLSPDSVRLDIYYRITNPRLSYIRKGDRYVASYEITAVLTGAGDKQAAAVSNRENYALPSFDETRRASGYLTNVLTTDLVSGKYTLTVTLDDRIAGSTHSVKRKIDLPESDPSDWVIGGPEFVLTGVRAPDDPRYRKGAYTIVPNVQRSFIRGDGRFAIYLEAYPSPGRVFDRVVVRLSQRTPRLVASDTLMIDPGSPVVPLMYHSDLKGFRSGEASLEIVALDSTGRDVGRPVKRVFFVQWSLETLVESDWTDAVDMLIHIATREEMDSLRNAPPDRRIAVFTDFWASKDPTPGTEENEWKEEYYRRVRFANREYANPFRPGWRTDFGTVYIRYGEPDDIERYPFEIGQKPHEIWYYYGQRRQFLFVDVRGNGEYELQYPYDGIIR